MDKKFRMLCVLMWSPGSSVSIETNYGPDNWDSIPGGGNDGIFFLCYHILLTGSGAHSPSYSLGTGSCFARGKAARA